MPSQPLTHAAGSSVDVTQPYSKLLSPHEAPRTSGDTKPQAKEPDMVQIAHRLYDQAKNARKDREPKWQSYWDFYNGKQWPMKRPSNRASPNVNIIRSVVSTILPILTDTSPSFGVVARDPNDFKFAELLTDVLRVWWNRRSMNHVMVECLMDAVVTDVGVLKVIWDDDQDDGLGDISVTVRDPRNIYVPKTAVDFDRDCPWVIDEYFMSRGKAALKFPEKRDEIKKASAYQSPVSSDSSSADMTVRVVSPTDRDVPAPDNKDAGGTITGNEDLRIWELWLDDDTVIEQEQIDEDGNVESVMKLKYPHGRVITILPDAKQVLQDVENPYRDGEKPFVRIVDTLTPRSFYGEGDVQPLMEVQRMINKVFAVILDWSNLMVNANWIIDSNSGVDPDMLTNQMGQVIVKNPGTTVTRDSPPPMPAQIFELYHTLMTIKDEQSGVHDVTQGRKPAGVTAAQAIETLQEAAQTRIRLKERNMLVALHRLGNMVISRMLQYYTEPRVIELTGRDDAAGRWPSYVKFFVEHVDGENGVDTGYRPVTQEMKYDEALGQYVQQPAVSGEVSIGQFELDVTTGTSLPFIKQQRSEQAIRLYEVKAIDQKGLLDTLEFPEKDSIMARMKEVEQAAASAQAQQQAPPQMAAA